MSNFIIGKAAFQAAIAYSWHTGEISDEEAAAASAFLWIERPGYWLLGGALKAGVRAPAAQAVYVPVVIGSIVSYGINGKEGVVDYFDFLEDVATGDKEAIDEKMNVVLEVGFEEWQWPRL